MVEYTCFVSGPSLIPMRGRQWVSHCCQLIIIRVTAKPPEFDSRGDILFLGVLYQMMESLSHGLPEFKSRKYIFLG